MFSGHGPQGGHGRVGPREEFVEAAVRVTRDDAGNDVGKVARTDMAGVNVAAGVSSMSLEYAP